MATPNVGEMILYDYIRPPLLDGEYRMHLAAEVTMKGNAQPLDSRDAFFNVEGPRFALSPSEVSGVFPPRNGHGAFSSALPHMALGRRTLPWERALGDAYTAGPDQAPYPWLALVVFQEGECEIKPNQPLRDGIPRDVFQRLGSPGDIRCDFVEADRQLLTDILPMPQELQLLTHVRQVNVDDRELAAGDSDGFFAVVMANRIPRAGGKHLACLVSVEERTDLLPTSDLVEFDGGLVFERGDVEALSPGFSAVPSTAVSTSILADDADRVGDLERRGMATTAFAGSETTSAVFAPAGSQLRVRDRVGAAGSALVRRKARLVLLHSWTFTCEGDGTFRQLLQHIDVGMMGDVAPDSGLDVTDTRHMKVDVTDRLGAPERAWYRGPLVPQPLTREAVGPYHSADQARRLVPDTGAEDVSYACAFEVGRLLAAADARLAQELMRWRRGAYSQSARSDVIARVATRLRLVAALDEHVPLATRFAVGAIARVARGAGPLGDPFGIKAVESSPLLRPDVVQKALGLDAAEQVEAVLGRTGALDKPVAFQTPDHTQVESFEDVLRDKAGLAVLKSGRARILDNVKLRFPPARRPQ